MDNLGVHCNKLYHLEERLLGEGLRRGEFYSFSYQDLPVLKRILSAHNIAPSVHCPLVKPDWFPYPPTWSFLSSDVREKERALSLKMIEETMALSADLGAEYVVVHFPTPASALAGTVSLEWQRRVALDSAQSLAEMSQRYGVPIHVEGFGPSPFLCAEFLREVFARFPPLRYCFDIGHMHLASQRDGFDYFDDFLIPLAPHIGSVHLWNVRDKEDYELHHHLPLHPAQDPAGGWADVPRTLRIIKEQSPSSTFILEYSKPFPASFGWDHREGIAWVREIISDGGERHGL